MKFSSSNQTYDAHIWVLVVEASVLDAVKYIVKSKQVLKKKNWSSTSAFPILFLVICPFLCPVDYVLSQTLFVSWHICPEWFWSAYWFPGYQHTKFFLKLSFVVCTLFLFIRSQMRSPSSSATTSVFFCRYLSFLHHLKLSSPLSWFHTSGYGYGSFCSMVILCLKMQQSCPVSKSTVFCSHSNLWDISATIL